MCVVCILLIIFYYTSFKEALCYDDMKSCYNADGAEIDNQSELATRIEIVAFKKKIENLVVPCLGE